MAEIDISTKYPPHPDVVAALDLGKRTRAAIDDARERHAAVRPSAASDNNDVFIEVDNMSRPTRFWMHPGITKAYTAPELVARVNEVLARVNAAATEQRQAAFIDISI